MAPRHACSIVKGMRKLDVALFFGLLSAAWGVGCNTGIRDLELPSDADGSVPEASADGSQESMVFNTESLDPGATRLVFAVAGDGNPQTRVWASGAWTEPRSVATPRMARWVTGAAAPSGTEELVMFLGSSADDPAMRVLRHDAGVWTEEWSAAIQTSSGVSRQRFADVAYETTSGDALVVHADSGPTPTFRTYRNGVWSEPRPVPVNGGDGAAPDTNTGSPEWVELVAHPATDQVALLYADSDGALVVAIWDGDDWVSERTRALQRAPFPTSHRAFDAAYEQSSGELVVVWSNREEGGEQIAFARLSSGGDWVSATTALSGFQVDYVDLEAAPSGNRIALAVGDLSGTLRLGLAMWDGDAWIEASEHDRSIRGGNGDEVAVVSWSNENEAICVYADEETGVLDWARWSPAQGWEVQADVPVDSAKGFTESVRLSPRLARGELIAGLLDSTGLLYSLVYDRGSWNQTAAEGPLWPSALRPADPQSADSTPFDLYARRVIP